MVMYNLLDEFGNVVLTTPDYFMAFQRAMDQICHEFSSLDNAYRLQVFIRRRRGLIETNFFVYLEDSPSFA